MVGSSRVAVGMVKRGSGWVDQDRDGLQRWRRGGGRCEDLGLGHDWRRVRLAW